MGKQGFTYSEAAERFAAGDPAAFAALFRQIPRKRDDTYIDLPRFGEHGQRTTWVWHEPRPRSVVRHIG